MPYRRALRLAAVLAILLIGLAVPSRAAAATADQVVARTRIHVVNPVTTTGLATGFHVVRRSLGQCQSSSGVMTGRGFRCISAATNVIYDPCFADAARSADSVVCLAQPWSMRAVVLHLRHPLPHHSARPVNLRTEPWGLGLVTGQRCISVGVAMHDTYRGRLVDYYCGRHVPVGVLHGLDRRCQPWTAALVVRHRGGRRTLARVAIRDVWYGQ